MLVKSGLFPGSRWWKTGFHVHTLASDDYESADATEEELLRAAMEADLDCIVITDHNSGGRIDKLNAKYDEIKSQEPRPEWYRDIAIFPGVGGIAIPAHIDRDNGLAYGIDKLAKLGGTNVHTPSDIGGHYSWVKMGPPTLAGLKLALMDHQYCVKNQVEDPNRLPNVWISRLEIENMAHCGRTHGQPFSVELNPGLNAFIGGRGSGKSTLIESMRIAMRQDIKLDSEAPKTRKRIDEFKKSAMLPNSIISVEVRRNEKLFRLRWSGNQEGDILQEKDFYGNWHQVEPGVLQERFPVSIFSQKQIEELAANPRGLLKIIDDSSMVNYASWNEKWESAKSEFLQLNEKRRDLLRRMSHESDIRIKLADLENDLRQYEARGHGEILKKYQKRILQKSAIPSADIFDSTSQSIRDLASNIGLTDFPIHLFDDDDDVVAELRTVYEDAAESVKEVSSSLSEIAQSVQQIKLELNRSIENSSWKASLLESTEAYSRLIEEYSSKGSVLDLSVYGQWTQECRQLRQQLSGFVGIKKELSDVETQIAECNMRFLALRNELIDKRRAFIESVIGQNPYVRMEVRLFGDTEDAGREYRKILNIEEAIYQSSILDKDDKKGILYNLYINEDDEESINLVASVKEDTLAVAGGDKGKYPYVDNRFMSRLKSHMETQPTVFDQLNAWFPEDLLVVSYSKNPNDGFHDIKSGASDGQKATAILAFLLSHGEEPLIIDQPEEDLDNELISALIVSQLHENKDRRQLIIATHNPNIVVNGIAELVLSLKFAHGQVQKDTVGGLGDTNVRTSICDIMEGGKDALDKRYKRITLGG